MGHHHSEITEKEVREVEPLEKPVHPFLEKNDLQLLSMFKPLLSAKGQKIISFFLNFNEPEINNPQPDLAGLIGQFMPRNDATSSIKELLPALMSMASNNTNNTKNNFNPAILTTLMSLFSNSINPGSLNTTNTNTDANQPSKED